MSEWICVKCGVTMLSKCPHQRNTFYDMDTAHIRSTLATHVINVDNTHKEVFLNLTHWGDGDPVNKTIEWLSEHKEKLFLVTCDHHFVLNSTTETVCTMGCKHDNLNDKEEILASYKPVKEPKVTFEGLKKEYIEFLGTQFNLANTNLARLLPNVRQDDKAYDEFRRWYFVFQAEMDQIKYTVQNGLERLAKDQPYRKKYEVWFGYSKDQETPNLYTDDLFQAEAVYKFYKRMGIKCHIGILRNKEKDSTNITYEPFEQDPDLRLRCCKCKGWINPGDKLVAADLVETDEYGWEKKTYNNGEVMHASCHKKIVNLDKEFTRSVTIQFSDEEMTRLSKYDDSRMVRDMKTVLEDRMHNFRYMKIVDHWRAGNKYGFIYGRFSVRIKGLGRHFDELKLNLKPKKETNNGKS